MKYSTMIAINKAEKEAILAAYPDTHIVRTMKQKSKRGHYFCEETSRIVKLLDAMRGSAEEAGSHRNNKKG